MNDLLHNLRQGARCALFRPVELARLTVSVDQLVALILLEVVMVFVAGYLVAFPVPEFYAYGVAVEGFDVALSLLGAVILVRVLGVPERLLMLCVLLFATGPVLIPVGYGIAALGSYGGGTLFGPRGDLLSALGVLYVVWSLAVLLRILALVQGRYSLPVLAGLAVFTVLVYWPSMYFPEYGEMWYSSAERDNAGDEWAAYRAMDAETLFYAQPSLLENALDSLLPGVPGQTDVYYLGFAAYARENVFRHEVQYARQLFDDRFGSAQRSLNLVNHLETRERLPLATATNLRLALQRIGAVMNPDEDILVLFLTSHGGEAHELAVDFWPLPLNDVTPAMLKSYLDEAGIRWRLVMVSSCYSGGFVAPLRDETSLVATASAPDRTSFGCDNTRDFTYFGEAVLRDQLPYRYSVVAAMEAAIKAINEREVRERRDASHPQLFVGTAMAAKLTALEQSLSHGECGAQRLDC